MNKRKICVVTGSRADYGLLYWVMKELQSEEEFELQVVATGAHLSPEFGLTYREIEEDGFGINEKVEMLLSSDTPAGITKSLGLATIGFADTFNKLKPDLLLILGDRYEMLAAAQAALIALIPVGHLVGGDVTEGAFDDAVRHSITKMSHLHFVTNEISARRVCQMGEKPDHIFNVGSPGLDYIKRAELLNRQKLETDLGFDFKERNLLVTFHPVTLNRSSSADQFQEVLRAIEALGSQYGVVFTKANADTEGRAINQMIDDFTVSHKNTRSFTSLGQIRYFSMIAQVDAVVGNSSSGILEVPSFKKPTVNIGDRQKGRIQSSSIINCPPQVQKIKEAIEAAMQMDCSGCINPYGDGESSNRIIDILKSIPDFGSLVEKRFYDWEKEHEKQGKNLYYC